MNLNQVLELHTQAVGGLAAIEGLHRLQVDFQLRESAFEADGVYVAERAGRMRVDIFIDGARVFTEGHDGSAGWQWPQDGGHGSLASQAGSRALLRGVEHQIFGLHELPARGHRLELNGQAEVDGTVYFIVKVVYEDGKTLWRYINAETGLVERSRERKALHVDLDPTETVLETLYSDFRPVAGGLQRAFQETVLDLSTGQTLQTTTVRQILINPPLDPDLFECP